METKKISSSKILSDSLSNRMLACIKEYEAIKNKTSTKFKHVKDFCEYHGFSHQNFMRIYRRYQANPVPLSLVPQQRGPKFKTRRTDLAVENKVIELRKLGNNRYEIAAILKSESIIISPSTIYNIFKRYGLNKLTVKIKSERRRIIMSKIGELGHLDCYQLSRGITIANSNKVYYLFGLLDDYSRVAWVEVLDSKKSLDVMFAALKSFNILRLAYGIEFEAVMTDNGAEFGSGLHAKNKDSHPFERLLLEMAVKHRYTKPYRPQTNGKIERFWKTLYEDFLDGSLYNDIEDLKNELLGFLVYYNEHRPHSAINGNTPKDMTKM